MPRRDDITTILVIGAGPIIIGQGCEFDYAGTQACKALLEDNYKVVLVNSNPATIMTDVAIAHATYIEPITVEVIEKIIDKEKPDAILSTMGGQTALNIAMQLHESGILNKYGVKMIGASYASIKKAEDRELFKYLVHKLGLELPKSLIVEHIDQALCALNELGLPCVIRSFFSLGGNKSGIAYTKEEFLKICQQNFALNSKQKLIIDQSIIGWKEFEMEVVRDPSDNCIIVCTIENLNPVGVHTGDSITVAPAQTLTDKEYQYMRAAAFALIRAIGIDTGGANVQFAVHPKNGQILLIEVNPRVSRSSALASKATGFPIAKVAAKLAVGYTLNELRNQITHSVIPCSFEPTIDYVVTKIPRFDFEKFPNTSNRLDTQMRSVGEVMAIGRNFQESLQKALQSLELGFSGLGKTHKKKQLTSQCLLDAIRFPQPNTVFLIADALRLGCSIEEIYEVTAIDRWFLLQIKDLIDAEILVTSLTLQAIDASMMWELKSKGFSDSYLALLLNVTEDQVRSYRHKLKIRPVYKRVDSCAAEFATSTAYMYSTYDLACEALPTKNKKVIILGSGPNRIGQGIEFDFSCTHAALALKEKGFEVIMVNSNPETVSTDYDISDRLYFEPLTLEHILEIINIEEPLGVIVQFGGQTPLKLASALHKIGVKILGSSMASIETTEDRILFKEFIHKLEIPHFHSLLFDSKQKIQEATLAYPIIIRPSYVLGGGNMKIIYNQKELKDYLLNLSEANRNNVPFLVEQFVEHAIEIDVDAVFDGKELLIGAIIEQMETAGIHSGDSICCLPAFSLTKHITDKVIKYCNMLAIALNVKGLMNIQFIVKYNEVYVLEVNLRASRTVPFVTKATKVPLAKIAALCLMDIGLKEQKLVAKPLPNLFSIKMPVFPFAKFLYTDNFLGPEMKSTGEVMGIDSSLHKALLKACLAVGYTISLESNILIWQSPHDQIARIIGLINKAFSNVFINHKLNTHLANIKNLTYKVLVIRENDIIDLMRNKHFDIIINIPNLEKLEMYGCAIRQEAFIRKTLYLDSLRSVNTFFNVELTKPYKVKSLQDYYNASLGFI
ncbi:carbamoyl-phosphate synthase large subunit [Cardinium endosymbiont of Oedothorax gibbosus]|uniref:carbamoyl-phosphate synthase large subunit n=1 Tax=Cardinium endosymbiont of Oedothorax gibbosus TaxID=931101 RepID=UPI0020248221|nr:carbamoyl-phosphate synthase large subunit [Cardinium endosymbiont of Oedothorax gibbosus]CAH2559763.1 Carbamoyl-phosphate synthase large chain [Cardinium endosymbiont of Oedothorax gibbosus]